MHFKYIFLEHFLGKLCAPRIHFPGFFLFRPLVLFIEESGNTKKGKRHKNLETLYFHFPSFPTYFSNTHMPQFPSANTLSESQRVATWLRKKLFFLQKWQLTSGNPANKKFQRKNILGKKHTHKNCHINFNEQKKHSQTLSLCLSTA